MENAISGNAGAFGGGGDGSDNRVNDSAEGAARIESCRRDRISFSDALDVKESAA